MVHYVVYGLIALVALALCLHLLVYGVHFVSGLLRLIGHVIIGPWLIFDMRRRETTAQAPTERPRSFRLDGRVQFRILHPFGRRARYWLAGTGFQTPQIRVDEYRRLSDTQQLQPVCVYQRDGLSWWWYRNRFWHASGHDPVEIPGMILDSTQVL